MLTIASVYKTRTPSSIGGLLGGSSYSGEWVEKLKRSVARHVNVPHRFVCLSDTFTLGFDTIPLVHGWPGWWSKVGLFRPGLFDGPVLYFDLDVVAVNDITAMAGPFEDMVMLGDIVPGIANSTAMYWNAADPVYADIYRQFVTNPEVEAAKRQGMTALGDQNLIHDVMNQHGRTVRRWQEVLPAEWFVPYSYFSALNPAIVQGLPEAARLVYSLGDPKFDAPGALEHVTRHWL